MICTRWEFAETCSRIRQNSGMCGAFAVRRTRWRLETASEDGSSTRRTADRLGNLPHGPKSGDFGYAVALLTAPRWLEPTDEVVSPHIAWQKPAYGEPLRVLFLTYRLGMREIVEVCQRFDIQREVFALDTAQSFASTNRSVITSLPGTDAASQEGRLRDKLRLSYDCIVIGNVTWKAVPGWARIDILRKVFSGTGLVGYINSPDEHVQSTTANGISAKPRAWLPAFPFAGLPAFRQHSNFEDFVRSTMDLGRYGKGCVALLKGYPCPSYQMLAPAIVGSFTDRRLVHYDYYLALVGHLLHWSAGREPALRVCQPDGAALRLDRAKEPRVRFRVEVRRAGVYAVELALRDAEGGEVLFTATRRASLDEPTSDIAFQIPPVPAGPYFADLWLRHDGKTVAFGSLYLRISSESRLADVRLKGDGFDAADMIKHFSLKDPITGSVTIEGGRKTQAVEVRQADSYGRLVARRAFPLSDQRDTQTIEFSLAPFAPLSVLQRLDVRLLDGDTVLDRHRQSFTYRDLYLTDDDVHYVLWQGYPGDAYLAAHLARRIRDAGFDLWWHQHYRDEKNLLVVGEILRANLYEYPSLFYPRPVRPCPWGDPIPTAKGHVRYPCMTNQSYLKLAADTYRNVAKVTGKYSTRHYDLGSECTLTHGECEVCFSPTCMDGFRDYAKQQYRTLDRLNAEYGTRHDRWDQVEPVGHQTALEAGHIPLWIDHRRHMDSVWANYFARGRQAISSVVPDARVGYMASNDGAHSPRKIAGLGGNDYAKLAQAMSLNFPYPYVPQIAATRDLSAPGTLIGTGWFGGYTNHNRGSRDGKWHRWLIWNSILRGANAITIWQGSGLGRDIIIGTTMAPDFAWYDFMAETHRTANQIRSGIGKLLMAMERPDDGIAVLYSRASMLRANFTPEFPGAWDGFASVPVLFPESGFQYRYISPQQLEQGALSERGLRLLYLPYCQALSDQEAQRIRAFVHRGGTVVADLRPGVTDEHGKARKAGALDDVFGIRQNTAEANALKGPVVLAEPMGAIGGSLPEARADGSLRLAGAAALARVQSAPAVTVTDYGAGRAVLLNFAMSDYIVDPVHIGSGHFSRFRDADSALAAVKLMREVFGRSGIEPAVVLSPHVPGCHAFRFRSGGGQIIGVLWDIPPYLPGVGYRRNMADYEEVGSQTRTVGLHLEGPKHVYDMLRGEYLGLRRAIDFELSPGQIRLVAALPYRVESLSVSILTQGIRRGQKVAFGMQVRSGQGEPVEALHVHRLEVTGPDAKLRPHYARNLVARQGVCAGTVPLALNETPGRWKLSVRDVATGISGQAFFIAPAN